MKKALIALAAFALPMVAFAAVNNLGDFGALIIDIINRIFVPVLFALAFIIFIWGAFQTFIWGAAGGEEVKDKGRNLMLWGLIGFFVMVSVWGLVNLLVNTVPFGNKTGPQDVPTSGIQVGR